MFALSSCYVSLNPFCLHWFYCCLILLCYAVVEVFKQTFILLVVDNLKLVEFFFMLSALDIHYVKCKKNLFLFILISTFPIINSVLDLYNIQFFLATLHLWKQNFVIDLFNIDLLSNTVSNEVQLEINWPISWTYSLICQLNTCSLLILF